VAIRVFLSSKMKEFDQERAALAYQIAGLRGFEVNAAEDWGAVSSSCEEMYIRAVRECHIYVGLFGRIYSASTEQEYQEACANPYRQKLIYLKSGARVNDREVLALIQIFQARHKPYRFKDLRDLQPRLFRDLDFALSEMLNQHLQLGEPAPVAQSGSDGSVSETAWRNKQKYLNELYGRDGDFTTAYLDAVRASLPRPRSGLLQSIASRWKGV
jgi:hypothetical protein